MTKSEREALGDLREDIGFIKGCVKGLKENFDKHGEEHKKLLDLHGKMDKRVTKLEQIKEQAKGASVLARYAGRIVSGLVGIIMGILGIIAYMKAFGVIK